MNKFLSSSAAQIALFAGIAFFAQIAAHASLCWHGNDPLAHITEVVSIAIIFSAATWRIKAIFDRLEQRHRQTGYALQDSQEKLEIAIEAAGLGTWEWEISSAVMQWSAQCDALLGLESGDFAGTFASFLQRVHPDDRAAVERSFLTSKQQASPWEMDYRVIHPDGSLHWMSSIGKVVCDASGQATRMLGVIRDITERKQIEESLKQLNESLEARVQSRTAELRQANQRLRSLANRLEQSNQELESFAFVASDDLKEPLRTIHNFTGLLGRRYRHQVDAQGQDYIERIQRACTRMQALIDDLLTLSRITTRAQPFTLVDLNQVVQNILLALETKIQETNARINVGELPKIQADLGQMAQLLQNLISNALKFHGESPPFIQIYSLPPNGSTEQASIPPCQIVVEDQGIGFDERYLDRIFQPFERLHSRNDYDGTGIGLAICRKIAERHRGSITAKSEPGQGAAFSVTLPTHHPG